MYVIAFCTLWDMVVIYIGSLSHKVSKTLILGFSNAALCSLDRPLFTPSHTLPCVDLVRGGNDQGFATTTYYMLAKKSR
jgi:hypothetical protein